MGMPDSFLSLMTVTKEEENLFILAESCRTLSQGGAVPRLKIY